LRTPTLIRQGGCEFINSSAQMEVRNEVISTRSA
jgi:hypothetical protein